MMQFSIDILRCPHCFSESNFGRDQDKLICKKCGEVYRVDKNIPIILDKEYSKLLYENYLKNKGKNWSELSPKSKFEFERRSCSTQYEKLNKAIDFIRYPYLRTSFAPSFFDLQRKYVKNQLVLNLSGGSTSPIIDGWINMDILDYETVDVVGDGANIPFCNGTFGLIVCNSVLEHVKDYRKIIEECYRILKPGGYFYLCVPQVCGQHHMMDFKRWTMPGLFLDMKKFKIIEKGIRNVLRSFCPF